MSLSVREKRKSLGLTTTSSIFVLRQGRRRRRKGLVRCGQQLHRWEEEEERDGKGQFPPPGFFTPFLSFLRAGFCELVVGTCVRYVLFLAAIGPFRRSFPMIFFTQYCSTPRHTVLCGISSTPFGSRRHSLGRRGKRRASSLRPSLPAASFHIPSSRAR